MVYFREIESGQIEEIKKIERVRRFLGQSDDSFALGLG
jgi:hypothetical protein